ncbi:helix-turn-helix transcriptional regulator [Clostridium sp. AM42-4]|uniref:helix-turn-helix domain-containing protein n=1 Tax=Clostridium sp. AM42-4 TaxID=2292305 RepID=UPI001FA99CF6|nr:helix-turn-helix transcriptional regulator [Clostridium sp. AM42-4]
MKIYKKIFTRLDELHMSQIELSKKTGIATSTISDWRKKKINPQADKLVAICKALDMSLINLLCDEDYREQQTVSTEFSIDENYMLEMFQLSQMLKGKALW